MISVNILFSGWLLLKTMTLTQFIRLQIYASAPSTWVYYSNQSFYRVATASVWIVCKRYIAQRSRKVSILMSEVRCPTCTQQHQLPTGGIPKLPVDFKSNQIIEIIQHDMQSHAICNEQVGASVNELHTVAQEAKYDLKLCTICKEEGKHVTGVQYCITCRSVLCDNCLAIHDRNRYNHAKVTLDCSKIVCKTHTTHFIDKYCLQCCVPVCMVCTMRAHSQHNTVEFVHASKYGHPANIDIQHLRLKLTHMIKEMSQRKHHLIGMLQSSNASYAQTKNEINHNIDSLVAQLRKDQAGMLSQLEDFNSTVTEKITSSDVKIGDLIESVGVIKCQLDDIEYPLGIDSVRLARHSSIQHCVEACSRIQHQPYVTMGMPLYEYKFGSVEAGVLMLKNDTNIKQKNVKKWIPA